MEDTELPRAANGKSIDVAETQKTNPIILSQLFSESAETTEINLSN